MARTVGHQLVVETVKPKNARDRSKHVFAFEVPKKTEKMAENNMVRRQYMLLFFNYTQY